jgi:hypothetical protein
VRIVSFDVESHLATIARKAPRIVCLSWAEDEKSGLEVGHDNIERWLNQHLDNDDVMLVGHFVAFDSSCVMANFRSIWKKLFRKYRTNRITCTSIREKLLDIAEGEFKGGWSSGRYTKFKYSMQDIAYRRLKKIVEKDEDTWRMKYGELDGIPIEQWPQEAIDYSIGDARTTLEIFYNQEQRINRTHYRVPTQFEDARADFALYLTSTWGIATDQQRVDEVWVNTVEHLESLVGILTDSGLARPAKKKSVIRCSKEVPAVKKSLKVVRVAIQQHYPGEVPRTSKDNIMTGEEVIVECNFEPLQKLVEFDRLRKTANTYLTKLFLEVVHASFYAIGAASDRTSCRRPNLQNQPRLPGVRECFIPRDGFVFCACDFDAQEMRTLAQSCYDVVGGSRLGDKFRQNPHFDPHLEFAASLCKVSVDEAKRRKNDGDLEIKKQRQNAKICNFGFPGGMGSTTFVDYAKGFGVELNYVEADELRSAWFQQWPEMNDYFKHVSSLVGNADIGYVTIPQSGFVRGGCGYCDAANTYFQSLAAHASKSALFDVCERAYCDENSFLYGSRPVAFIHDEVIIETPKEAGPYAGKEMEQVMIDAMQRWTPDVPVAASALLMNRWSKKAEPVYDRHGNLKVWEG